jgi:hypothetical protein
VPSQQSFWYDHLPQLGSFLLSPIAGFVASYLFRTEECATVPGGRIGELRYGPSEICSTALNEQAGALVACIVLVLAGVWLAITIYHERQGRAAG